jgi:ubiquinone/menaquinone biosynthesis C-methylase UbiE
MDAALQIRVQRYGWDRAAEFYDASWQEQLKPAQDKMLEMAALKPGEMVLETACGSGLVTFRIASAVGPDGEVIATDLSDKMVEITQKGAAAQNLKNVTVFRMDAEKLAMDDRRFDGALCALGLMYVPDPLEALKEMHRVLKPGGKTALAIWGERKNCGFADIFPVVEKRVASDVCPMFFQQGTGDTLYHSLQEAGFQDIKTERIQTSIIYNSQDQALMAAFAGGPVALAYRKFDEATKKEAHEEYLDSISAYKSGKGYQLPGEFVIASARK